MILWIATDSGKLSGRARETYLDEHNEIYLSVASLWELAIKISMGRLSIKSSLESFVEQHVLGNDIGILKVSSDHIFPVATLPFHHKDPFDRLLIAQSVHEKLAVISTDRKFDAYSIERIW